MRYWLVKSEPEHYSWEHLLEEGDADWDGVRNYQARNFLRSMEVGDLVLYYHSGKQPHVIGTATVTRGPFPDPTDDKGKWTAVGIRGIEKLARPVYLHEAKADPFLSEMALVRSPRLSVQPVTEAEFHHVLKLSTETDHGN